jgi:NAD(P)-dependent dehydrogenase (short-subunit alcohol dehydrogenase family)
VTEAVAHAERAFGAIDVLVNNAGYGYLAAVEEGEDHEVRAMFEANFFGLAALIRRVLPGMRARGRGHIINISSVGGLIGNPSSGYYNATKFAVEGLSEALAKEVEPLGIRVTVIGPVRSEPTGPAAPQAAAIDRSLCQTSGARRAVITGRSGKRRVTRCGPRTLSSKGRKLGAAPQSRSWPRRPGSGPGEAHGADELYRSMGSGHAQRRLSPVTATSHGPPS